jgi:hypothetical protein
MAKINLRTLNKLNRFTKRKDKDTFKYQIIKR